MQLFSGKKTPIKIPPPADLPLHLSRNMNEFSTKSSASARRQALPGTVPSTFNPQPDPIDPHQTNTQPHLSGADELIQLNFSSSSCSSCSCPVTSRRSDGISLTGVEEEGGEEGEEGAEAEEEVVVAQ